MESLPTEILQKILGYLPFKEKIRAERVCKRWKNISTKEVWKDVKILGISIHVEIVIYLLSKSKDTQLCDYIDDEDHVEYIELNLNELFINSDGSKIIQSVLSRSGQNVKKIILDTCLFNETSRFMLSIITTYCHNIEGIELDRSWPSGLYPPVSVFEPFLWLLQVNKQLHSVRCSGEAEIVEILPLKNWKSLDIWVRDTMRKEWENKMIALFENSPSLENLRLNIWTPNILVAISQCKQLKTLTLARHFPDPALNDIMIGVSPMNNLKELKFVFEDVDEGTMWENISIALIEKSPSIEKLEVFDWTLNILAAISRCKQLESLTIVRRLREPDKTNKIEIPWLNDLKFLKWGSLGLGNDDPIIDLLCHQFINLRELHLWQNIEGLLPPPQPLSLELEQAILALSKLDSLTLGGYSITDENLSRFVKLKYLAFRHHHCTEDGIFKMIMNSECLEKLKFSMNITVEFTKRLVESTRMRRKILTIDNYSIAKIMLEICEDSRIRAISGPQLYFYG